MVEMSPKLSRLFERAQFEAMSYHTGHLETWEVLLAMAETTDSVAGRALADFGDKTQVDHLRHLAERVTGYRWDKKVQLPQFVTQSPRLQLIMEKARGIAEVTHSDEVGTEHVLYAMLLTGHNTAVQVLLMAGFSLKDKGEKAEGDSLLRLRQAIERHAGFDKETQKAIHQYINPRKNTNNMMANMMGGPQTPVGELSDYTRDLTAMAEKGQLEPVIGRDSEVARMIQILSRKTKNNPVLVGDAGVGKTALASALAQRLVQGQVPVELAEFRVLELDMMSVLAGTRFRGDFEERMNNIIAEIEADAHIILFVDELHTIMGSGSGMDSTLDAANILKPALARGTLHMVGATTQDEYQKHIEKDAALSRRFAKVLIEEPTTAEALAILEGLKASYEEFHHVQMTQEALETAVSGAKRYLTSKNLPDSAIDLIDEAASKVQNQQTVAGHGFLTDLDQAILDQSVRKANQLLKQLATANDKENRHQVTEQVVLETLSQLSGIPVAKMTKSEAKKYLRLEEDLHKRVIGQDAAISAISRAIRRNQSGIRTGKRPIGSFMFLGPTGVGKTELAKALAELLFDDESALIRFDMSEYMEKFAASRLNGAPPGYVGYDEGGELTEKVRNRPYSVLLFDEIEKAHPDTFNLLLQVLDDGVLTDSRGRQVDFSNTIIIMTSNLGATALRDDKTVGFGAQALVHDHEAMQKRILEELKRHYRPEFINRIDEKVVFHSLTDTDMKAVVKLMVKPLIAHLAEQGKTLKISAQALDYLAKKGYDPEMGARPLRRTLQTDLEDSLAEWILSDDFKAGDTLKVGLKKNHLHFEKV